MIVFLLRHGIAVERGTVAYPNDDRPLTERGRKKAGENGRGIVEVIGAVDLILTSPLARAAETALITAAALGSELKPEECKDLGPGGSMEAILSGLARRKRVKAVLLVGHEPDLGYLASHLLGITTPVIRFKKGGLCCIELDTRQGRKSGILRWHLTPKQLRRIGTPNEKHSAQTRTGPPVSRPADRRRGD